MNSYEQAALIFYWEKNFFMSYNLFLDALNTDEENTMFWYGLGDSLCAYSRQKGMEKLYSYGIACVKKAYEIDPGNEHAAGMLNRMKENPAIGENVVSGINAIPFEQAKKLRVEIPADKLIENYHSIDSLDKKVNVVMHLGDTKDARFGALIKDCILNGQSQTIRFSALKRIAFFQNDMDLQPLFDELISTGKVEENEPYFSLAAGGINAPWAKKIYAKFNEKLTVEDLDISPQKLDGLLRDENVYMSLSMLFLEGTAGVKSMIKNDQRKGIGDKLAVYLKPKAISELTQKEVMNDNGEFTTIGVELLKKQMELMERTSKNQVAQSDAEKVVPVQKKVAEEKKWWKFW